MKEACTKAYAYCRYSSHNQDDGWSIESQKSALSKYAKTNQIQIVDFFIDGKRQITNDYPNRQS